MLPTLLIFTQNLHPPLSPCQNPHTRKHHHSAIPLPQVRYPIEDSLGDAISLGKISHLQAECVAVRSLGSNVEAANQTLVDSMCDMSGESA